MSEAPPALSWTNLNPAFLSNFFELRLSLAAAWRDALGDLSTNSPGSLDEINTLAAEVIGFLSPDPSSGSEAGSSPQEIGRRLAYLSPESDVLKPTLTVLAGKLGPAVRSPEQLGVLLSAIAAGYAEVRLDQTRKILDDTRQELKRQVSERRRTEADLREQAERLRHLHSTHLAILSVESLPAIVDLSLRLITSLVPNLSTSVVIYDFQAGDYEVLHSNQPEFIGLRRPILLWNMIDQLRRGEIFYIEDIQENPESLPGLSTAIQIGGRSFLGVPLIYRNELIGALTMTTRSVHGFSPEELAISREIANSVAVAIQHQRLLDAEKAAREREITLREIATTITSGLELEVVLDTILEQLERMLPAISASIMLLEEGKLRVSVTRGTITEPQSIAEMLDNDSSYLMDIVRTGRPRLIADTDSDPDWISLPGGETIRAWLGIPLTIKGTGFGILTIDRDTPNAFKRQDLDLALAFANQAAIAIENARLFREVQTHADELELRVKERTRELQALFNISTAAAAEHDMDVFIRRSLEQALAAFDSCAGCIFLESDEADHPQAIQRVRLGADDLVEAMALIPVEAIRRIQEHVGVMPVILNSPDSLPAELKGLVRSYAIAPLRARGHMLGIISLLSREPDHFDVDARPLLTTIADQIGAAVENIRLRQKAREAAVLAERDRLARDLHDAVTQNLYSLSLFAEAAHQSVLASDPVKVQRHLGSIIRLAQLALGELRLMLFELREDTTVRRGLAESLAERLRTVEEQTGIITHLQAESPGALPVAMEEAFYRVGLEALNNSLRHSRSRQVDVSLRIENGWLVLVVADDGTGFDNSTGENGGLGLKNMAQRMETIGGELILATSPGGGTRVEARAPLPAG